MSDDYRNTKYCPILDNLSEKKKAVKNAVLTAHPKATDMHRYISDNDDIFKQQFIEAYNGKCAYCGVSISIIPWKMFEIDHFIPKDAAQFKGSKAKAGYIDNLVLSCYDCNRAKSSLEIPDGDHHKIYPDGSGITESYFRDEAYYIRIRDAFSNDNSIKQFYEQLNLDSQMHRLDYLLMNLRGLREKISDTHPTFSGLTKAIDLLQQKRNVVR